MIANDGPLFLSYIFVFAFDLYTFMSVSSNFRLYSQQFSAGQIQFEFLSFLSTISAAWSDPFYHSISMEVILNI